MELQDLSKQCKQHLGESVLAWLLWLWDEGTENTELSPSEASQLTSTTAVPSLQCTLQDPRCTDSHTNTKTPINWLMAAAKAVWDTPGDMPEHVTKWSTCLELVHMLCEMGIRQMTSAPHYCSPDEELLMPSMKDLVLANGPTGTFGAITALLVPYTDHLIDEAASALARLGDVEVK